MNRTITTILMILPILVFAVSPVAAQTNTFEPEMGSTTWHDFRNWSLGHVPTLDEDVLIPSPLTAIITDPDVGGLAKSVEVQSGATLGVDRTLNNASFLHLRPPISNLTGLTVDGKLYFRGHYTPVRIPARLIIEVTGSDSEHHVVFTGSGVITAAHADDPSVYGPALITDPDDVGDDPWGFKVDSDLTFKGEWNIPLSLDNVGLVLVDGPDTMDIFSPETCEITKCICEQLLGDGTFRVSHAGGTMLIRNREDFGIFGAVLAPHLNVSAGLMHFKNDGNGLCDRNSALRLRDGSILVSGGALTFDDGFNADTGGATIDISGGTVLSMNPWFPPHYSGDTQITISGGLMHLEHNMLMANLPNQDPPSLTISGTGKLLVEDFRVDGGAIVAINININGSSQATNSLRCDNFDIKNATVAISAGEFHLVGVEGNCALFSSSTLTLSGGTFFLGGTFNGSQNSSVTVSGGVLDIQVANPCEGEPDEDFRHQGPFSFTGGKIKVAQNKTVLIGANLP